MRTVDLFSFVATALTGHRLRSALSALGVTIGIAAVILLTSLGQGTREYMVTQFSQFGTNLIVIHPGKVKTMGMPGVMGGTTQKITIEDALSLEKTPSVDSVLPLTVGMGRVEHGLRGRSVYIYGVTHNMTQNWKVTVVQGSFLPKMDPQRQASLAVLGPKLARELFPGESPLGQRVRIGGSSFVVIGVLEPKGQFLGFDMDDIAYIPVANAMRIFNLEELFEIDLTAHSAGAIPSVVRDVRSTLMARHRGQEDFTITTEQEFLDAFGKIMEIITMAVSAIAGISLVVGAIGILTIMWISVHERTGEIGLLTALGVGRRGIAAVFLTEAALLSLLGGVGGLALGFTIQLLLRIFVPALPLSTPPGAVVASVLTSIAVGLLSGYLPARRAASLDPIEALRAE